MGALTDANALYRLGVEAHQHGDFRQAEGIYRQVLAANPRHFLALFNLAVLAGGGGKPALAIRLTHRALSIGGPSFEMQFFLGTMLAQVGERNAARTALVTASKLPSNNANALYALGVALAEANEPGPAQTCWRAALQKQPQSFLAHNALGESLLAGGQPGAALESFEAALALAPSFVAAAYNRREAQRRIGGVPDPCADARTCPSTRHLRCAVVTPVGPGHEELFDECTRSVTRAFSADAGPFAALHHVRIDDTTGLLGRSRARNEGVRQAAAEGADYVFFLDADDLMAADAFAIAGAFLPAYDAVWGAISSFVDHPDDAVLRANQLWCSSSLSDVLFNEPFLTLQMGHFVRTAVALQHPFDESLDTGEDFDYYLRVWADVRCLKIPKPLFHNRRGHHSTGPRAATGRDWTAAVDDRIRAFFDRETVPCTFAFEGTRITFHIKDPKDLIQRHFIAGAFFESDELRFLRDEVAPASRIVDVGANVGNHAVFFGLFMRPESLILLEPNPDAFKILEANLRANGLDGPRIKAMRVGAGNRAGRYSLIDRQPHNLGAVALEATDGAGDIEVQRLDDLVSERVDVIKIDVEGMEMDVLEGARKLIAAHRPRILIEIRNANMERFRDLVAEIGYDIKRRFRFVNSENVWIVPSDKSKRQSGRNRQEPVAPR
jgi:FkbM family methyltransferase